MYGRQCGESEVMSTPALPVRSAHFRARRRRSDSLATVYIASALLGDDRRARVVPVTKRTSKLLDDALKLEVSERAELASELIASLDAEADEDPEAAWAVEIEERAARARSGEDPGKPWPEVR